MPKPKVALPASPYEDKFWNTPVATARTLRFTDNLMDEEMEPGGISEISLTSPKLSSAPTSRSCSPRFDIEEHSENKGHTLDASLYAPCESGVQLDNSTASYHDEEDEETQQDRHDGPDAEGDNPAVRKMHTESQPPSAAVLEPGPVSPVLGLSLHGPVHAKIRVNSEVERIVVSLSN
jgi:hypothetical protein